MLQKYTKTPKILYCTFCSSVGDDDSHCHTLDLMMERTIDVYAMQSEQQTHPTGGAQHDPGRGGYGGRGGYRGQGGGRGSIVCYNCGQHCHFVRDYPTTTCTYCKAFNHAIEECLVLLAKIQEKQQNLNVQFIEVEQWPLDPTVNVVTRSGVVTGGQQVKPNGAWVQKVEEKQPSIDLNKIKETFVHISKEFCIPHPPSEKGKGPEIVGTSTELHSDWKASTSSTSFQENELVSNIKSFL